MAVYKRNGIWWYEFWFAHVRIRESAKTDSETLAKEAERSRRRELEQGYNRLAKEDRSKRVLTLAQAAEPFLTEYKCGADLPP